MRWLLYALVALLLAGLAAAALFPVSLALRLAGDPLTGTPSGTIWRGRVADAAANGQAIGDVALDTRVWPTLIGRPAASLRVDGPFGAGSVDVVVDGQVTRLTGIDAALVADAFGFDGPLGQPLTGTVRVTGDLAVAGQACREADLSITTDVLVGMAERLGQTGPVLSGPAACEDGALVARLEGTAPDADASALVRIGPGRYVTELALDPAHPRAGAVLSRYGFRRTPEGYTLTTRGTY